MREKCQVLFRRTAPPGLVIFAPMILVFSLFHVFLNDAWWPGALTLVYIMFLAWVYRRAFVPLRT